MLLSTVKLQGFFGSASKETVPKTPAVGAALVITHPVFIWSPPDDVRGVTTGIYR